jgi:hypothetical protein
VWLDYWLRQTNAAMYSVNQTEHTLREFLMFFVGVQPTANFFVDSYRVVVARIWRILNLHPEFAALDDRRKRVVWQRAAPMGASLLIVKKESAARGMDQLRVRKYFSNKCSLNTQNYHQETWGRCQGLKIFPPN